MELIAEWLAAPLPTWLALLMWFPILVGLHKLGG
jgi:hypothetical protein